MKKSSKVLQIGARDSRLSILQTEKALEKLGQELPQIHFELITLSSPGDRDKSLDLRQSPEDFFTRDLDQALLKGKIDAALHSAKDLPTELHPEIDWFWLPWRADPRDVIICPQGKGIPQSGTVGVSSERREAYCRQHHPGLEQKTLRGTMEERLEQLDSGAYDMMVTAAAAMERLGWEDRITGYIPSEQLPVPEGQGVLAVTFRKGDQRMEAIRSLYTKAVRFVSAGSGRAGLCTVEGVEEIDQCDICFHDALIDPALPKRAGDRAVPTGKRSGQHSLKQPEISHLILTAVRQGKRVVRLKGGDSGIFGRLKEEIDLLEEFHFPYRVIPGVSSMIAATTGSGLLLTQRGSHRGFTALTPMQAGGTLGGAGWEVRKDLPLLLFMSVKSCKSVFAELIGEGRPKDEPAAVVFDGGSESSRVVRGTLETLPALLERETTTAPGLLITGDPATSSYQAAGALKGQRVLLTCSPSLGEKGKSAVIDLGGIPLLFPLIELVSQPVNLSDMADFDWVCLTSPTGAHIFLTQIRAQNIDLRHLPKIMVCGNKTALVLKEAGLYPDLMPSEDFSSLGLLNAIKKESHPSGSLLKLGSDLASPLLGDELERWGWKVDQRILYTNERGEGKSLPDFDSVVFASSSGVNSFIDQYGVAPLAGKAIAVMGLPTAKILETMGIETFTRASRATIEECVKGLSINNIISYI